MSVAVCSAPLLQPVFSMPTSLFSEIVTPSPPQKFPIETNQVESQKQRFDIFPITSALLQPSILMTQNSFSTCTESLGSETGSDEFPSNDELDYFSSKTEHKDASHNIHIEKRDLHYCSIARRFSLRSFPPPLPSISRRDGPCIKMQPRRCDGRLVIEAVPATPVNYLLAERRGGRLLLSFMNAPSEQNNETEDETEDEEVEVLDRGTTVEVKVSKPAAVKFRRSSLVINKFVGGGARAAEQSSPAPEKKSFSAATTAAAAAVAAAAVSALSSASEGFRFNYLVERHVSRWSPQSAATEARVLFSSKRRSREELLRDMRRCSELRRPLFIFEPVCCVATS